MSPKISKISKNDHYLMNAAIWKTCPKDVFINKPTLVMGVDSAVINFNAGLSRVLDVVEDCG